jgi:hypothetical protein
LIWQYCPPLTCIFERVTEVNGHGKKNMTRSPHLLPPVEHHVLQGDDALVGLGLSAVEFHDVYGRVDPCPGSTLSVKMLGDSLAEVSGPPYVVGVVGKPEHVDPRLQGYPIKRVDLILLIFGHSFVPTRIKKKGSKKYGSFSCFFLFP